MYSQKMILLPCLILFSSMTFMQDVKPEKTLGTKDKEKESSQEVADSARHYSWAGVYHRESISNGSACLTVSPKSGFSFEAYSRFHERTCLSAGEVLSDGRTLVLSPKFKNEYSTPESEDSYKLASKFHYVKWGKVHYLIGENELVDFANEVNSGAEYSDLPGNRNSPLFRGFKGSRFFFRDGRNAILLGDSYYEKFPDLPDVPKSLEKLILKKPIRAVVTKKFDAIDSLKPLVSLNAGAKQGVFLGMKFYHAPTDMNSIEEGYGAIVIGHSEETCLVRINPFGKECVPPQIDDELSTALIPKMQLKGYVKIEKAGK